MNRTALKQKLWPVLATLGYISLNNETGTFHKITPLLVPLFPPPTLQYLCAVKQKK